LSLNYLISIGLIPYLKFDLFWSFNFSPLYILVLSNSFNSKTLDFLHFFWNFSEILVVECWWRWYEDEKEDKKMKKT